MSLLSELSRGTGKSDGAIIGEGFENLASYSAKKSTDQRNKSSDSRVPSTYLTRRGNLVLYTRADQPPKWETQVLDHYKNMGSLLSQMEEVALNKNEMKKEMDQRCSPGRPLNPYLGLLKNSLFFPRMGLSTGLELLPRQLEEMGVNIAEFLRGKGSLSHLLPPEEVSDLLRDIESRQRTVDLLSARKSPIESVEHDSTQPTPAPPQSPLPDETNPRRNTNRSASARLRRTSGRTVGSARSAAQYSDVDSAYGTNKLPPIVNPVTLDFDKHGKVYNPSKWVLETLPEIIKSADISTIMSDSNYRDTPSPRLAGGISSKLVVAPPPFNNSGEYARPERSTLWLPEVSEGTTSVSVEDIGNQEISSKTTTIAVDNKQEKTDVQPSQIRTAQWINTTSDARAISSQSASSIKDQERAASQQSHRSSEGRFSTLEPTVDESLSELQKLKSFGTIEYSSTVQVTETPTESTPKGISSATEVIPSDSITSRIDRNNDLIHIQSYAVDSESTYGMRMEEKIQEKTRSSRTGLSHSSSAVSSISIPGDEDPEIHDRNASNAYGVSWNISPGDITVSVNDKESGITGDGVSLKDSLKPTSYGDVTEIIQQASEGTPHGSRPISRISNTTSGAGTIMSQADHFSKLEVPGKTEVVPLLDCQIPVRDRIGTPVLNVTSPSPKPETPDSAPSVDSLSPRPPSSAKPRQTSAITSPKRQVRAKATRSARRTKPTSPTKSKRPVKTATSTGKSPRPPPPELGEEDKARIEEERLAIQAAAAAEKERRLAQAAALQNKIKDAEEIRREAEREAERKKQEMESELRALAAEEDAMKMMEEETRQQMMATRKEAREAREKRRRDELERKKEEIRRRKEDDIRRQEMATKREREMLDRLGDPSLRQRMANDDAARRAQQERELEERLAEEELDAAERAAAEERRMEEFERLAEEEAISRLREDMDDVEERRRDLKYRAEVLEQEKEERRLAALEEERKIEEEKRLQEEINRKKQEEEEQARIKLELEEEQLRTILEKEYEERQQELMKRREHNMEMRSDLQHLHHRQQITRPWVFSYYVHWPRELFERPIGGEPAKPKRFRFPNKTASKKNDSLPPL